MLLRRTLGLLALSLACAASAAADTPLWEEEVREGEEPERWVRATGFAQPALVLRLSDDDAPRQDHAFLIQRARLGVEAQPFAWARLKLDVAFAPTPEVNDAYVELTAHPALRFRLGRFRLPFLLSYGFDERDLTFVDRPLFVPASGPDRPFLGFLAPRGIGAMVSGLVGDPSPSSMLPVFEYELGVFTGGGSEVSLGTDYGFLYAGRVRLHALGYPEGADVESDLARNTLPRVAVGGAVYSECVAREGFRGDGLWHRGFTADLEARWRGAYLSGSFLWLRNGRASDGQFGYDACGPTEAEMAGQAPPLFDSTGAHVQLQYVLPDLLLPKRHELELSARFDYVMPLDPDPSFGFPSDEPDLLGLPTLDAPVNAPEQMRLSFGVSWYPMGDPTVRVRLSYHHNRELQSHAGATGPTVEEIRNDQLWLQLSGSL